MDMLNEGAGKRDAAGISADLRGIGASLGSSAGLDGSGISLQVMKKNLGPGLDIMADVALRPTFPRSDWELMRKKRLANLATRRRASAAPCSQSTSASEQP